jgi:tetratricopeptide (TPR) repeat protein
MYMKKIGLGTRPSQVKKKEKKIEFGHSPGKQLHGDIFIPKKAKVKRRAISYTRFLKITAFVAVILLGGFFLRGFWGEVSIGDIKSIFTTEVELDHIKFITEDKKLSVNNGESFNINFRDGLQLNRITLKGFYRFFPPNDMKAVVAGFEDIADLSQGNLLPLLKPEDSTTYDVVALKGDTEIGRIAFSVQMDASDWIARAATVEDKQIQTICYNKAITLDPSSEGAHIGLGRIYEQRKQTKKAIVEYETVIKNNPENTLALESLIPLYKRTKRKTKLIGTYQSLAELDAAKADEYYYNAGLLADNMGSTASAMELYRKALAANRTHVNAREKLIKIYEKDKQWNRVVGNTQVMLEMNPNNADLHLYLSEAYLRMNQINQAINEANKAAKLKPRSSSIHLQLALLYEKDKKQDKAIEHYKKAVKLNKKNATAYNNLGMLLEKKGNRKEAIKNYKSAVSLKPKNKIFHLNLADAYEKEKEWSKALREYEKVVKLDKEHRSAWEAIAVLSQKVDRKDKAMQAYRALSTFEPKKILWHKNLAVLYESMGRLDHAKKEYETILKLDPNNKEASQKLVEISIKRIQNKLKK